MKKENTAIRLRKIMSDRNLRQVDILNLTAPYCKKYDVKMNKSDISQYCSGKTEPNQDKLFVLGIALNVSEAWLMGYDVPMERNNFEDQNLIRFDAELDDAWDIIEKAGYSLSFSDDFNKDVIIVKNKNAQIVLCAYDYELVNKYESLMRNQKPITAQTLLFNSKENQRIIDKVYAFDCQLKALGWTYQIVAEPNNKSSKHAITYAVFKNENISFKASLEDCDLFINDGERFYKNRLQDLLKKSMNHTFDSSISNSTGPLVAAAHERTDIEVTEEMRKHDDNIMTDDSEWE